MNATDLIRFTLALCGAICAAEVLKRLSDAPDWLLYTLAFSSSAFFVAAAILIP